ncbi:PNGase F N-terminal domain-containing protein [Niabella beijingensis]|uniref:PNGase F N-terminal domain-containing protein n=1 Tax=Niabella beijingensis TaxID=2872700 RepID=UPI001CBD3A14|nr:PNGase F N-terminal domain-containing protein [Niabella beijingensis]MBZ4187312.1 peptide-N-glycosidase [Niabella beijingensis]
MKIKASLFLAALSVLQLATGAQVTFTDNQVYKITYTSSFNGKTPEGQHKIWVFAGPHQTLVTSEKDFSGNGSYPFELSLINRPGNRQELFAFLNEQESISASDTALRGQQFELLPGTKDILGYQCKKAKTVVNSNTIELWYTDQLPVKGAPTVLGQNLGLVLEQVRNGNNIIKAEKVEKQRLVLPGFLRRTAPSMDLLSYRDAIWKSRFTAIPLFRDQVINFSDTSKSTGEVLRFANGTIVVKKLRFPEIGKGSSLFLDLTEQSNGDAYDRTGTVFLIPVDKKQSFLDGLKNGAATLPVYTNGNGKKYQGVVATPGYTPPIELMRFFTPFGIKQYNHIRLKDKQWEEAVPYRQDITDFAAALSNREVWIGVFIGNYDRGGHRINATITLHRGGPDQPQQHIIPLFNTLNIMEMAGQEYATMFDNEKGLVVHFRLDTPLRNARLLYTTTGHGGWGNGDEFVPRQNTILLNNKIIFNIIPWRQDCGTYRLYNPASGNFNNGLSSSDLSRSNWCPGTVTNPFRIDLGNLEAGEYTLQVKIPQGPPEGSSFSAWNVSGTLIAD